VTDQDLIDQFNAHAPGFINMLGGRIVAVDALEKSCTIEFDISKDFCHSVDIVQGGFITVMLDAAMSHAAYTIGAEVTSVSSLEIKTSYLEPTRAGKLRAEGRILKSGYKLAFMEGRLYDANGLLTATTSTVAKLVRGQ
jgi:uncharacterized protein (TIGR00369 family)